MIVVLSDSVCRWLPRISHHSLPMWRIGIQWLAGISLVMLMLPDVGLVHYLVHIATEGIEASQPLKFQRAGTFPNHGREGFRLYWISCCAVLAVSLAALCLVMVNRQRKWTTKKIALFGFITTTLPVIAFCIWYYG